MLWITPPRYKIPNRTIRNNTGGRDAIETILRMKCNWYSHVARVIDSRWTNKILQGLPKVEEYRNRGQPQVPMERRHKETGNWTLMAQDQKKF